MEKVVSRYPLNQQPRDTEYWLSRPPGERLDAVEQLRQQWLAAHPDVVQGLQRVCALLNSHRVEYLVVGGYAVAMHGRPRHTGDLDVWVRRSPENASKLMSVLREFGFGALGLEEGDFLKREQVVQLGYPPFRIDLLTDIDGVEFATAWSSRESFTHDGLTLNLIGLSDLKQNKQATARPRDMDDLENLP